MVWHGMQALGIYAGDFTSYQLLLTNEKIRKKKILQK